MVWHHPCRTRSSDPFFPITKIPFNHTPFTVAPLRYTTNFRRCRFGSPIDFSLYLVKEENTYHHEDIIVLVESHAAGKLPVEYAFRVIFVDVCYLMLWVKIKMGIGIEGVYFYNWTLLRGLGDLQTHHFLKRSSEITRKSFHWIGQEKTWRFLRGLYWLQGYIYSEISKYYEKYVTMCTKTKNVYKIP